MSRTQKIMTIAMFALLLATVVWPLATTGAPLNSAPLQTVPTRTPTPLPVPATATPIPPTATSVATATPLPDVTGTPTETPTTIFPTSTVTSTVTPTPTLIQTVVPISNSLALAISGPTMVQIGEVITIMVEATNASSADLSDLKVQLTIPTGLVIGSSSATAGNFDAATSLWNVGVLAAGQTRVLTLSAVVDPTASFGGVLDVIAQAGTQSVVLTMGLPPAYLPEVGADLRGKAGCNQ